MLAAIYPVQSIIPFILDTLPVFPRAGIYILHSSAVTIPFIIFIISKNITLNIPNGTISSPAKEAAVIKKVSLINNTSFSFISLYIVSVINGITAFTKAINENTKFDAFLLRRIYSFNIVGIQKVNVVEWYTLSRVDKHPKI